MKIGLSVLLLLVASASILSQTPEAPPADSVNAGKASTNAASNSATSIVPELDRLQVTASQTVIDIGRLRIERWKANSHAKGAAQADADSVQRNLNSALPGLIAGARSAPEDVNAQFKLYRNLNALCDVLGTLTEATRVFGQKGEYDTLSHQSQVIGSVQRKLGEALEQLTATTQTELNQMRVQIKTQQEQLAAAEAAVAKPKETVVAQTEPPKKPAKKKKTVKPATATGGSNANSTGSNPSAPTGASTTVPKS